MLVAASVATAARVRGTRKPDRLQTVNAVHDVVTCGGGYDLATVDGFDRVGQDCETVTRRTSLDPYRNPVSEHATEVEPDSAAFGTTVVAVFQVGRYFDGGSHNIGFAVSRNSGLTWRHGFLHGLTPRVSDPAIAYDQKHGEWLAISLVFGQGSYLAISRSSDGRHWSNPVQAVVTRNAPRPGQGVDRLRQLAVEPAFRQLLHQLQRSRRRPGRRAGFQRRRAHLVAGGRRPGETRPRVDRR